MSDFTNLISDINNFLVHYDELRNKIIDFRTNLINKQNIQLSMSNINLRNNQDSKVGSYVDTNIISIPNQTNTVTNYPESEEDTEEYTEDENNLNDNDLSDLDDFELFKLDLDEEKKN